MRKLSYKLIKYYYYKVTSILFFNRNKTSLKFTKIYLLNSWGNNESVSGPGSTLKNTKSLRKKLPLLCKKFNIKSILDVPCGDFNWMKNFLKKKNNIKYMGGDIVKEIIANNNKLYKKKNISFKQINILKARLPKYDLMICRDCLMHFSNEDIFKSFINFSNSSIKYLLTTSHLENKKGKFKNIINKDIVTGGFRFLDLFSKPFNLNKKVLYTIDDCEFEIGKKIKSKMYLFTKQDIKRILRANKKL